MKSNYVIASQLLLALLGTQVISAPLPDSQSLQTRKKWCLVAGMPCTKERDNEEETEEAPVVPEVNPVENLETRSGWCASAGMACAKTRDNEEEIDQPQVEEVTEATPVEDIDKRNRWCLAAGQACS